MVELTEKIKIMRNLAYASLDKVQMSLKSIYELLDANEDRLKEAFELDKEGTDRKEKLIMKRLLDNLQMVMDYEFDDTKIREMDIDRKLIEFKQNQGVIGVIYDGDVYMTLDLICKALKTNNAIILNVGLNNFFTTNNLIFNIVRTALNSVDKPEGLVELNFSENNDIAKENFDQLIVIGDRKLQTEMQYFNLNTIRSGYGHTEIYIEDLNKEEEFFIKKVLNEEDVDVMLYIKNTLETDLNGKRVNDIAEAIIEINKNGAGYASSIFSNDSENHRTFMRQIKSKYIFVKATPTLVRDIDIDIEKLYTRKIGMI